MAKRVTPFAIDRENEAEPNLINLLVDGSGSMDPIKGELAKAIMDDFIGAFRGINQNERPLVRVGAEVFGTEIKPLWDGFKAIWELDKIRVTESQLNGPGLGGWTALHKSTMTGFGHLLQASSDIADSMNKNALGKLIVLTDAANNCEPKGQNGINQVFKTFRHPQENVEITKILVYFETELGLNEAEFINTANECGFDEIILFTGLDHKNLQKEIRTAIRLLSDKRVLSNGAMPRGVVTRKNPNKSLRW
jgi:hypothetical protein